jgi:hypothetical protein
VEATDYVCRPRIICVGAYECVQADMCRHGAGAGHGYVQVQATDMCRCRSRICAGAGHGYLI